MKIKNLLGMLGASVLLALPLQNSLADNLNMRIFNGDINANQPQVTVRHTTGATEAYDTSFDSTFLSANTPHVIDFYSEVPYSPFLLKTDARPIVSYTTITSKIKGRNLGTSLNAQLKPSISNPYEENAFTNLKIYGDLYSITNNSRESLIGTYNLKTLSAAGEGIPLTVTNGHSYDFDIRFVDRTSCINETEVLPDGNFKISFSGVSGETYCIQAASNLNQPIQWEDLCSNIATNQNGVFNYSDLTATNFLQRYYRMVNRESPGQLNSLVSNASSFNYSLPTKEKINPIKKK